MHNQAARKLRENVEAPSEPAGEAPGLDPNRRQHQRHAIALEVEIDDTSDHNFYTGITLDLSEGGVFVATHLEKRIGTLVDLVLHLPGTTEPLRCSGEVRWVRAYSESSDSPPGLGIRFVALDPSAHASIQRFLSDRAPLFYDD